MKNASDAFAKPLRFDPALIRKYDGFGPRYTSYPTADRFDDGFTAASYVDALVARGHAPGKPLSLYVHLPFCNTICYYCACNKVITANRGRSAKYVRYLGREIEIVSSLIEGERTVQQLHWGGGTPTFLAHDEMAALMRMLRGAFAFDASTEASIEVDPRKADPATIGFCGRSASTASRSASRISTPRCRPRSTASRAKPRPAR